MHRVLVYLALAFSVIALVISVIVMAQGQPGESEASSPAVSMLRVTAEDFPAESSSEDEDTPDEPEDSEDADEPEDQEDSSSSGSSDDSDVDEAQDNSVEDVDEPDEPESADSFDDGDDTDEDSADDEGDDVSDDEDSDELDDADEDESEIEVEVEVEDEGIVVKIKQNGVESLFILAPGSSEELQKILSEVTGGQLTFEVRDGVMVVVARYLDENGTVQETVTPIGENGLQLEIVQEDGVKIKVELSDETGDELHEVKITITDPETTEPVELEIDEDFSLTIDVSTNQLVASTATGASVNLMTMPVSAFLRTTKEQNLSDVSLKLSAPTDATQSPVVEATGTATRKVFGLFPVEPQITVKMTAVDGAIQKIDQPIWMKLFGFLMTKPAAE